MTDPNLTDYGCEPAPPVGPVPCRVCRCRRLWRSILIVGPVRVTDGNWNCAECRPAPLNPLTIEFLDL